jgi:hypothetical protein
MSVTTLPGGGAGSGASSGGGGGDVNIIEVAGTSVVEAGVNGVLAVGGPEADGAAAASNPVQVAGVDGAGDIQALLVDTDGRLQVDIAATIDPDINLAEVGGNAVVSAGVNGLLAVGGGAADGGAASGHPVQVGGKDGAGNVQSLLTDTDGRPQNDVDRWGGTDVLTGGVAGSPGIGGLAADGAAAAGNPVQVGGVEPAGGKVYALMVDNSGRLMTDLDRVGGVDVVDGGVSGALGVGGPLAHSAAVGAANPVMAGAEAANFDGSALPNAVSEGDVTRVKATMSGVPFAFLVNEDGSATPQVPEATAAGEGLQVSLDNGTNSVFAQGDTSGNLKVVGTIADDAAADASAPVKGGAVADEVPSSAADGDLVHLITDLERYLRVVSKAYDSLTGQDLVSANTAADDRDESAQVLADVSDAAADTYYYPSSAGVEIGNRTFLSFILAIEDVTSVAFEVSNDGTAWVDGTKSVVDAAEGANGYAAAHFTEPDTATVYFAADWERCGYRYIRCAVVVPDGTNECEITLFQRSM